MSCHGEDHHLRSIFPEEVWLLILDQVMLITADSLENCANSSPYFRRLLDTRKVKFLFPKVLDIMLSKRFFKRPKKEENATEDYSELLDNNIDSVDKNARKILKLRLVCTSWKKSIDQYYYNKLLHGDPGDVPYGTAFEQNFEPTSNWMILEETTTGLFLSHFSKSHASISETSECSPFLSRGCTFVFKSCYNHEVARQYDKNIKTILRTYGHHLHKCTFDFGAEYDAWYYRYKFQKWLWLLPNLRKLEIISWRYDSDLIEPIEMNRLEECLSASSLPRLEYLENLVLDGVSFPLESHLLQANNHVSRLWLEKSCDDDRYDWYVDNSDILLQELPNLKHLKTSISNISELRKLKKAHFNSSFHTLELEMRDGEFRSRKMFVLLKKLWGETLTSLTLLWYRKKRDVPLEGSAGCFCRNSTRYQRKYLPLVTKFRVDVKLTDY